MTVAEGSATAPGIATFTIGLSAPSSEPITFDAATSDGTATAGSDYVATATTVTMPAGSTVVSVDVHLVGDATFERLTETFTLALTPASGVVDPASDLSATANIVDDDPAPTVVIADAEVSDLMVNDIVSVSLVGSSSEPVWLRYTMTDGTATATPGGIGTPDYLNESGWVRFEPSSSDQESTIPVSILADGAYDPGEYFTIDLSPVEYAPGQPSTIDTFNSDLSATISIIGVETLPLVTITDAVANEGDGTTVTLSRDGGTVQDIALQLTTQDGTATAGTDYTALDETYTFPASAGNAERIYVRIETLDDDLAEADETITIVLTPLTGTIAGGSDPIIATVTIIDDD